MMDKIMIKKAGKRGEEVMPAEIVNPIEYVPDPIFNVETGERQGIDTVYSLYTFKNLMNDDYTYAEPRHDLDIYLRRNALTNNFELRVNFLMDNFYTTVSNVFRDYMKSIMKPNDDERYMYFGNFYLSSRHDYLKNIGAACRLNKDNIVDIATTMTFEMYNSMINALNRCINRGEIVVPFEEANKRILSLCVEARNEMMATLYTISLEAEAYRLNGYSTECPEICAANPFPDLTKPYMAKIRYDDEY